MAQREHTARAKNSSGGCVFMELLTYEGQSHSMQHTCERCQHKRQPGNIADREIGMWLVAEYFASLRLVGGVDRVPLCNEETAMSQQPLSRMQIFRLAAREVKPHCDATPTQNAALLELAERLRKEGWQTSEVDLFVAVIRRLVLSHAVARGEA